MSSIVDPQSEQPADELVAYLDGELAPDDCRRVEDRLAADPEYRQQLRDLDQAWEALNALPTTAVDDGFARTTIELACVAAEEDLTHRSALASAEMRSSARWWIAALVAAAVVGFVITRTLILRSNNALLADLPVIQQVDVLPYVKDIEFLRRLSEAKLLDPLVKDEPVIDRNLTEFKSASSAPLDARREWVNSLSMEQQAELAARARIFGELKNSPHEQERLRKLARDIGEESPELQKTLVAYGQWLSRLTSGEQEQLRDDLRRLSTNGQVELIQKTIRRKDEQASRHLSADDAKALHEEIVKLVEEKKAEFLARLPRGRDDNRARNLEGAQKGQAVWILYAALQNDETGERTAERLVNTLSPEQRAHWDRLGRWHRDFRKKAQLAMWVRDAMRPKWGPDDLERFFASDKLSNTERQRLLEMSRPEMEAKLEQLYLSSELGMDDRGQWLRDFGEPGRMPRDGPGAGEPEAGSPRVGPPPDRRGDPDGPQPPNRFERDRPPGPGGMRGPRREDGPEGRRQPNRPGRLPPEGPPPPKGEFREAI